MSLIDRAKNILLTPKTEWEVIAGEEPNTNAIITGYAVPLILVGTAAAFIGFAFIGLYGFHSITFGILYAICVAVASGVAFYANAFIVDAVAPSFGSEKNMGRAMQIVAYSSTASWVAGIFYALPMVYWIAWAGTLYGAYLAYLGLPSVMKTPQDKLVPYTVVVWLAGSIIFQMVFRILLSIFTGIIVGSMVGAY